jgi:hypothetical protein
MQTDHITYSIDYAGRAMSALPLKADMCSAPGHVC